MARRRFRASAFPPTIFGASACTASARAGMATVFPQAIGMAATWDTPLIHDEADVIATEARAKYNDFAAKHNGNTTRYHGLTFWTPNINIFRDPRWGRGQETYGEDPFLTARTRRGVHQRLAGRRSELRQGDGVRETFCRPQRAGTGAA